MTSLSPPPGDFSGSNEPAPVKKRKRAFWIGFIVFLIPAVPGLWMGIATLPDLLAHKPESPLVKAEGEGALIGSIALFFWICPSLVIASLCTALRGSRNFGKGALLATAVGLLVALTCCGGWGALHLAR